MFIAVNLAVPVSNPIFSVHLLGAEYQPLLDTAPYMELLTTGANIAFNALTVRILTHVTFKPKLCGVQLSPIARQLHIVLLEPYLVDPVNAHNMHPLFAIKLYHRTLSEGT